MTSLAKQLKKLAIPGKPSPRQSGYKKRLTLLFDPKEAADIDISTIHCIGINGLEELIIIEPSFSDFEITLFNESCKDFERAVQSKEYLEVVDKQIGAFLRRLSPYFLIKPAQKCLEWLIRAFHINIFNMNAVMECILPYYETKMFAQMLQLLPLKDPISLWHWLRPIQKLGAPVAKQTLVQHCISDHSLLVFVCDMVPLSLQEQKYTSSVEPRVLIAFYSSTVTSVLESVETVTEEMVSCLLPYIVKGIKSFSIEYRAASMMIVCKLASVVNLKLHLCLSLMEVITKNLSEKLSHEGLICMCVLCQMQKVDNFSERTLKYLLKFSSLVSGLSSLAQCHSIVPLMSVLMFSLLTHHFDHLTESSSATLVLLLSLLNELTLEEDLIYQFTRKLVKHFVCLCESDIICDENEEVKTTVGQLAQSLNAKYPNVFDKALEDAISHTVCSSLQHSNQQMKHLQYFISLALPQSRHQVMLEVNSTLALSIHHPNPLIRAASVKQLADSLEHKAQDKQFVSTSLLRRLSDDDPTVVSAVLDIDPRLLFQHLPSSELVASLATLLNGRQLCNFAWQTCALKALKVLTTQSLVDYAGEHVNDVIITSLPLLFISRHGCTFAGNVGQVICSSDLARIHPSLVHFSEIVESKVWLAGCDENNAEKPRCLADANDMMFSNIGKQWACLRTNILKDMLSKLLFLLKATSNSQTIYYVLLAVAGNIITSMPTNNISLKLWLILHVLNHLRNCSIHMYTKGGSVFVPTSLSSVFEPLLSKHPDKPHSRALLVIWLLGGIVEHLGMPDTLSTGLWLEVPSESSSDDEQLYYHVLVGLFSVLSHFIDTEPGVFDVPCKYILSRMIQLHLSMCGFLLRFLAMIWTAPLDFADISESCVGITPALQGRSLNLAAAYLRSRDAESIISLLGSQCPVVPSLFIPLMSPHKFVRDCVLACLNTLNDAIEVLEPNLRQETEGSSSFIYLVQCLCSSQVGLSSDPSCLQKVLMKVLNFITDVPVTPSKSLRKVKQRISGVQERARKDDIRAKTLDCVLLHIVAMGAPLYIQYGLLKALINVDEKLKFTTILPMMDFFLKMFQTAPTHQPNLHETVDTFTQGALPSLPSPDISASQERWRMYAFDILNLLIKSFTPKMAANVQLGSIPLCSLLKLLHTRDFHCVGFNHQELALRQLTTEFFNALDSIEVQQTLFGKLIDLLVESKEATVVNLVKQQLSQLCLSVEIIENELTRHNDKLGGDQLMKIPSKKPRYHKSLLPAVPKEDDISLLWKRVTVVLEDFLERKHSVSNTYLLMPSLFDMLSRCLEAVDLLRLQLEYTQQLILSSLLYCCVCLTDQSVETARGLLSESQFNVELVVQCVRLSSSPQIHHHALLLLSTAAPIYPSRVLHNVMPIFTFMGTHILDQDDQYSSQVTSRIISSIIPALMKSESSMLSGWTHSHALRKTPSSRRKAPTSVEGVVQEIIHVFVDALPHVPDHRKLSLLLHLLETVHPEDYLHVALGLLLEKAVVNKQDGSVDLLFPISLAEKFSIQIQLIAMLKLLNYLAMLPKEKPTTVSKLRKVPTVVSTLFHIAGHTNKQLKQFKHSTISFLNCLVAQELFCEKVLMWTHQDATALEDTALKIIQNALKYTSALRESKTATQLEGRRFWQIQINKTHQFMSKVVSLLSSSSFLIVVTQLLTNESNEGGCEDTQRKGLDILKSKLATNELKLTDYNVSALLKIIGVLMGIASETTNPPANRQSALLCVKLFTQKMGSQHTVEFIEVAGQIKSLLSANVVDLHPRVVSGCLLCVAELFLCLDIHCIPFLPSLMPHLLRCIGQEKHLSVQRNAVAALGAVVETLPKFLSSYLCEIITKLCSVSMVGSNTGSKDTEKLAKTAAEVREKISSKVPGRSLLPTYNYCYFEVLTYGKASVAALQNMLKLTIRELRLEDAKVLDGVLMQLFVTALNYRAYAGMNDRESVDELETQCLEAFTSVVMKMSETRFGPMFLKLLDWASHPSAPKERLITFYHLADSVADKLKNLFLLFAGHIVKNAASLLEKNHIKKQAFFSSEDDDNSNKYSSSLYKSCCLLSYILQCLGKVFMYDKGMFLTEERFETLLHPLVDQVSNNIGGPQMYRQRVKNDLAPCIASFAVAAGKESLWKPLNYQLLLKTRHLNTQVRFSALTVLHKVCYKLKEEFMILLPETIPFLAEVMEDDCEEVQQQTHVVINTIEDAIGESIWQHLT